MIPLPNNRGLWPINKLKSIALQDLIHLINDMLTSSMYVYMFVI